MKSLIIMAALAVSSTAFAAEVGVGKNLLGSGVPVVSNPTGVENASVVDNAKVENNILHAPQYMPYHPTAATIWPRVVEVPCTKAADGKLNCAGYNWNSSMGRAEYLFVAPRVVEPTPTEMIVITKTREVPVIREVLIEVPAKKKKE